MIGIINYGSGNIRAISNIYDKLNVPYIIADSPKQLDTVDKMILPGVGAFDETIKKLETSGFRNVLDSLVLHKKIPILGICVGMQIMAKSSEEGALDGLGWIDATVVKFDSNLFTTKPKVPHLGWNSIEIEKENILFDNINLREGFYFVHSYYFDYANFEDVATSTFYGLNFASSVIKGNIMGVQFHPEKSHTNGIQLLSNFALI